MKVAIVTDQLVVFGGQERILQSLLKIFPGAEIYSSFADFSIVKKFFPKLHFNRIHLFIRSRVPFLSRSSIIQLYAPIMWKTYNLENYDLVFSISSYLMCNHISVNKPTFIQYICSPPKNIFGLVPYTKVQKIIPYTKLAAYLYRKTLLSTPFIITLSEHIEEILYSLYGIDAAVIYPPVNISKRFLKSGRKKYFLCITRLSHLKNVEIVIKACNHLKLPLKIVGKSIESSYEFFLKSIAGPTIEFLGMRSDEEIDKLYKSAIAFIFTARNEDFGIAPVEAMAHGIPVIAYYGGGLKETVVPGKTGLFFYEHSTHALIKTLKNFSTENFDPNYIYNYSKRFSEERFIIEIKKYIQYLLI